MWEVFLVMETGFRYILLRTSETHWTWHVANSCDLYLLNLSYCLSEIQIGLCFITWDSYNIILNLCKYLENIKYVIMRLFFIHFPWLDFELETEPMYKLCYTMSIKTIVIDVLLHDDRRNNDFVRKLDDNIVVCSYLVMYFMFVRININECLYQCKYPLGYYFQRYSSSLKGIMSGNDTHLSLSRFMTKRAEYWPCLPIKEIKLENEYDHTRYKNFRFPH